MKKVYVSVDPRLTNEVKMEDGFELSGHGNQYLTKPGVLVSHMTASRLRVSFSLLLGSYD